MAGRSAELSGVLPIVRTRPGNTELIGMALDNLEAILAVPGLDVVFVGPYDLSQSPGVPGQTDHPRVAECVARGMRYVSFSVDVGLMTAMCAATVRDLKAACKSG